MSPGPKRHDSRRSALAGCAAAFLGLLTAGRFVLSLLLRLDGLRRAAAGQKVLRHPIILLEVAGSQGRSFIARFQLLHGLVEPDRRLCGCGPVGAWAASCGPSAPRCRRGGPLRVGRIAQQVQRPGGVLFRVQQDAHTEGGIQLLPAGAAIQLRQALVVVGALLLALGQMLHQGVHAVSAGLFLPVPAQQLPADVVAGRFYLERGLPKLRQA